MERAAGFGLPQDQICQLVISERTKEPISKETLEKHFRAELDRGAAKANYEVISWLHDNCRAGKETSQIWWTKVRCGWKETIVTENHNQHRYDSMSTEDIVKVGGAGQSPRRESGFEDWMNRRGFLGSMLAFLGLDSAVELPAESCWESGITAQPFDSEQFRSTPRTCGRFRCILSLR